MCRQDKTRKGNEESKGRYQICQRDYSDGNAFRHLRNFDAFEIPLWFAPSFYEIDFSEVPVLIGAFALGY